MAIEFRCKKCRKLLRTGDGTAGKQAQCPVCDTVMAIPSESASAIAVSSTPAPSESDTPLGPADSGLYESGNPFLPAGAMPPPGPISQGKLELSDVFDRTWTTLKSDWRICLGAVAMVWAIGIVTNMASNFVPILGPIAAMAIQIWINIGQAIFFLKKARGQDVVIEEIFRGWPYFWRILGASILVGLVIAGITAVCVLPLALVGSLISRDAMPFFAGAGVVVAVVVDGYVMLALSQFYYLILDQNVGIFDALRMSTELMTGNKRALLLVWLLSSLAGALLILLTCGLGLLAVAPFLALMYAMIYLIVTHQPTVGQNPIERFEAAASQTSTP